MATKVATGQITIVDTNDYLSTGSVPPPNPVAGITLWCDTSVTPNQLKKWTGTVWTVVNDVQVGGRNQIRRNGYFGIYNNFGVPATLVERADVTLFGESAFLLTMTPDSASLNDFKNNFANHGVMTLLGKSFYANTQYVQSIYWKPVSHADIEVITAFATNIGGWIHGGTISIGNGWYRTLALRDGSVTTDKFDNMYFSFRCPSAVAATPISMYWACPQLEVGNRATDWNPSPEDVKQSIEEAYQNIGGRNLISQSPENETFGGYALNSITLNSEEGPVVGAQTQTAHHLFNGDGMGTYRFFLTYLNPIPAPGYFTVSFWFKHTGGGLLSLQPKLNGVALNNLLYEGTVENTWKKYTGYVYVDQNIGSLGALDFVVNYGSSNWFYLDIAFVKVEYGKIATDWTPAPQETNAAMLDYLREAIDKPASVSGGLTLLSLLLARDAGGTVKSGISGVGSDNVGLFTGGTYEQAIADAAKAFKAVMDTGVLDRKDGAGHRAFGNLAWNTLGDVFVRGLIEVLSGGKIGNFTVESGQMIGRNTSGAEKIRMSTEQIPSISELQSGTLYTGAFPSQFVDGDISNPSGSIASGSIFFDLQGEGFTIPYATTAQVTTGQYDVMEFSNPSAVLDYMVVATAYVYKDGALYWSGPCDTNFSIVAGYYTVKIRFTLNFDVQGPAECWATYGMDDQSRGIQYTESVARSCFGANGFFSYWSSALYMYFSSTAGFTYRGALNFPGMLAAGNFSTTGIQDSTKRWGNKSSSGNATYTATGQYRVPHAIGHANFTANITCLSAGAIGTIVARASTYVDIVIQRNGANFQSAFDIMLVGNN